MNYSDIYLTPKYSTVKSRSNCDTSVELGGFTFNLPIVPSNMETVINLPLAKKLALKNYFYIMHRFLPYKELDNIVLELSKANLPVSISIGVKERDYETLKNIRIQGLSPDFITVDIAHGHHELMKKMMMYIKARFPDTFLIAGNVATAGAVIDLQHWGADAIKVGVAPGLGCRTYNKTGFLSPMFSTIWKCSQVALVPLIADGGIREPGDIAKALVAGATMVMIGSYLAGHIDSPGEIVSDNGNKYKLYSGSTASNQFHVEGRSLKIPLKGYLRETYKDITESLQSAISYAGGNDLSAFNNVGWRKL